VCVYVYITALRIRHAKRIFSEQHYVDIDACLPLPYFTTFSHKRYDFRKNVIEHKMCVLVFSTTFVWNIFHSEQKWVRYDHKYTYVFIQRTRYSCPFLIELQFPEMIVENYSNIKFLWKFVQDGRADRHMTKLTVAFRNFSKVLTNECINFYGETTNDP
jgi:hypothetical protein